MESKYKYTMAAVIRDGKEFKICSVCGKECASNAGFELEFNFAGSFGRIRAGTCRKCGGRLEKAVIVFLEDVLNIEENIRKEESQK